jgi:hypothetical protein
MSALADPTTTSGGGLVLEIGVCWVCVLEGFMAKERTGCLPFDGFCLFLNCTNGFGLIVLFVSFVGVFWVWRCQWFDGETAIPLIFVLGTFNYVLIFKEFLGQD